MVQWVVGSILHGGPIELFFVPTIAPRIAHEASAGFLSHYLSGPLPYVLRHITVNKMC